MLNNIEDEKYIKHGNKRAGEMQDSNCNPVKDRQLNNSALFSDYIRRNNKQHQKTTETADIDTQQNIASAITGSNKPHSDDNKQHSDKERNSSKQNAGEQHGDSKRRADFDVIGRIMPSEAHVLDLGCGSGDLLKLLVDEKRVTGFGVEMNEENIISCVSKGLSVHHGNLESIIDEYPEKAFDFVILSLTLQAVKNPHDVIKKMLTVGRKAIVSFPNFAYLPIRYQLAVKGCMPKTADLPYEWYNTPNIHLTTVKDFKNYCKAQNIRIENEFYFGPMSSFGRFPNLLACEALFVIG
jgi:methionine biosynthesis protein MetW